MGRLFTSLMWSPEKYLVRGRDYEAPNYEFFFQSHITSSFSAPYSQTPKSMFLLQCDRPRFRPIKNNREIYTLNILIYLFFDNKREDERFWAEF